jgi:hypothetical protein
MVRLVFRPYTQIRRTICHIFQSFIVTVWSTPYAVRHNNNIFVTKPRTVYSLHISLTINVKLSYGLTLSDIQTVHNYYNRFFPVLWILSHCYRAALAIQIFVSLLDAQNRCTSVTLRASIRISPDFTLFRHRSPSFGSQHKCSYSNLSQVMIGR